jgi:hypothetical protein
MGSETRSAPLILVPVPGLLRESPQLVHGRVAAVLTP